jgi:hypothetical protein
VQPSEFEVKGVTLRSHLRDWWQLHKKLQSLSEASSYAIANSAALMEKQYRREMAASIQKPASDINQSTRTVGPAPTLQGIQRLVEEQKIQATLNQSNSVSTPVIFSVLSVADHGFTAIPCRLACRFRLGIYC